MKVVLKADFDAADIPRVPLEIVDDYRDSAFAKAQTGLLFNLPVPTPEHEQLPAGISLCMIVKNEERFLAGDRSIHSPSWTPSPLPGAA